MNLTRKAILVMTISILTGCGAKQTPPDPMVLVVNERSFAAAAAEKGMRDAFIEFSSDDAVMFAPEAVRVKEHYQNASKRPGLLSWQPIYAEIASGGDMGWTTGPWEYRPQTANDTPVAWGEYNTIWQRQADSTWKFVLDFGTAHGPHQGQPPQLVLKALDFPEQKNRVATNVGREELIQLEYTFSSASASEGPTAAYLARISDDIRIYRIGEPPAQGVNAASAFLGSVDGTMTWKVQHADVSANSDLGYTFGVTTLAAPQGTFQFSFMHIWRRNVAGLWKLALDIQIPLLSEQEKKP